MSAPKNFLKHAILLAIESAYNTPVALSASTDGIHTHETPEPEIGYLHDGIVSGRFAGTGGSQHRVPKSGLFYSLGFPHYVKTPGVAYSAAVKPTVHNLLRIAGRSAAVVTGAGVEKWTYTPFTDGTFESATIDVYTGKEKYGLSGVYANRWEISSNGLGVPTWKFNLMGAGVALPLDAAVPSVAYPNEAQALVRAAGMVLTLTTGGQTYQLRLREFSFVEERAIEPRSNLATLYPHPGFQLGDRTITCDVTFEATTLPTTPFISSTAIDPYSLADTGAVLSVAMTIGTVQYKRYKITGATVNLVDPKPDRAGSIKLWNAKLQFNPSTSVAEDDAIVVFD